MKPLIFIFGILLASLGVQAQEAHAYLSKSEITLGEQAEIELELKFQVGQDVKWPILKDTLTKNVEIIKVSELDTTFDEEDVSLKIITQKLTITSWDSGFHAIRPFTFIVGSDSIKTEALLLQTNSVQIDPQADIKDIKPLMEVPFSLSDYILAHKEVFIGVLALLILIGIGIYLFIRYRNRPQEEEEIFVPKEAADKLALRKLSELESKKLWQSGKVKEYYVDLSFILREYISNRYQLHALEHTTEEIMLLAERLPEIEGKLKQELRQTLALADLAKYAKQEPLGSESEAALSFSKKFVEATAIKEEPSEGNPEEVKTQSEKQKEEA